MRVRRHLDQEHAVAEAERVAELRREEHRRMAGGQGRGEAPATASREIPARPRPGTGRA